MPRKPTVLPPLVIEGLSGGLGLDDWGKPLASGKPKPSAEQMQRLEHERRAKAGARVLIATGRGDLVGVKPEPVLALPQVAGKRAIAIKLGGETRALVIANPPWRRV